MKKRGIVDIIYLILYFIIGVVCPVGDFSTFQEVAELNISKKKNAIEHRPEDVILNSKSPFSVVEAYKNLRTNVMYSIPRNEKGKTVVITSSSASEGKTTTCINLAITFAQMNARVLLMDCDLRKPRVYRYLKLDKKEGISNVLCGFADLENTLQVNVRENLDVLASGDIPPNPAELLQTKAFDKMMAVLQKVYDYIIIDTPPINVVMDAANIIKHSDGTILLVKKGATTYDMVDDAIERLEKIDAKLIGTIMIDDVDNSGSEYKRSVYNYRYKDSVARPKK